MEPKDPNKKFDDLFKNLNFSFNVPVGIYNFNNKKAESPKEMTARLDADDAVIDAMTSYPTAEKMLNDLFSKDK